MSVIDFSQKKGHKKSESSACFCWEYVFIFKKAINPQGMSFCHNNGVVVICFSSYFYYPLKTNYLKKYYYNYVRITMMQARAGPTHLLVNG